MKGFFFFFSGLLFAFATTVLYTVPESGRSSSSGTVTPMGNMHAVIHPFSIENAPGDSLRGKVATISGSVLWESRIATQPAQLITPQVIQQGELLQTGANGFAKASFAPLAYVNILPNSQLNIIQLLPGAVVFVQDSGQIEYVKGNAAQVSVRSMDLLLQIDGDAVVNINDLDDLVNVKVNSGSVTAAYDDVNDVSNVITIPTGNSFTFDDNARTGVIR